jgi:hypothetical protein
VPCWSVRSARDRAELGGLDGVAWVILPAGSGPAKLPRRQQVVDRGAGPRPAGGRGRGRLCPSVLWASGGLLRGGVRV